MYRGTQALRLGDLEPASGAGESGVRENGLCNLHDLRKRSRAAAQAHLLYFTYRRHFNTVKRYPSTLRNNFSTHTYIQIASVVVHSATNNSIVTCASNFS